MGEGNLAFTLLEMSLYALLSPKAWIVFLVAELVALKRYSNAQNIKCRDDLSNLRIDFKSDEY